MVKESGKYLPNCKQQGTYILLPYMNLHELNAYEYEVR